MENVIEFKPGKWHVVIVGFGTAYLSDQAFPTKRAAEKAWEALPKNKKCVC